MRLLTWLYRWWLREGDACHVSAQWLRERDVYDDTRGFEGVCWKWPERIVLREEGESR